MGREGGEPRRRALDIRGAAGVYLRPMSGATLDSTPRDFTEIERKELLELLGAQRRQAWIATGVGLFLTLLFCARMLLGHITRGDEWIIYGLVAVVVLAIGLILGKFTWAPTRNLLADLAAGKTAVLEGPISQIAPVASKFGETYTYAFIGETRVYNHGSALEVLRDGDRVCAVIAPRSRYAFEVAKVADMSGAAPG